MCCETCTSSTRWGERVGLSHSSQARLCSMRSGDAAANDHMIFVTGDMKNTPATADQLINMHERQDHTDSCMEGAGSVLRLGMFTHDTRAWHSLSSLAHQSTHHSHSLGCSPCNATQIEAITHPRKGSGAARWLPMAPPGPAHSPHAVAPRFLQPVTVGPLFDEIVCYYLEK